MKLAQLPELVDQRNQRLVEAGEADLCLELDAFGAQDPDTARGRVRRGGVQQRSLPEPGIGGHQQSAIGAGVVVEERPDESQLGLTTDQRLWGLANHVPSRRAYDDAGSRRTCSS
jgi:hypothetical protein